MEQTLSPQNNSLKNLTSKPWAFWIFPAFLVLLGVLIAFLYWRTVISLNRANHALNILTTQFQNQQSELKDDQIVLNDVQAVNEHQESTLNTLQNLSRGNIATWRLAEAKYLVQLANYHLTFTHDVPASLALLQTAEMRVASLNDPTLQPIRQLIADNIAALQAVPRVDLAALLTRIAALQTQALSLPTLGLSQPIMQTNNPDQSQTETQSTTPLRQAMSESWSTLQKVIVVHRTDQPIQPLLSPEQQAYLQQNLQLILQQAQWAALRGNGSVYQESLQQAQNWIQRFFAKNLYETKAFLVALTDLQKIEVQPKLPDLSPLAAKMQELALPTVAAVQDKERD